MHDLPLQQLLSCSTLWNCDNCAMCRTPQGLRALLRTFSTIVIPIYVGPYWAAFQKGTGSFAFVVFLSSIVRPDISFITWHWSSHWRRHGCCKPSVRAFRSSSVLSLRTRQDSWIFDYSLCAAAAEFSADSVGGGGFGP